LKKRRFPFIQLFLAIIVLALAGCGKDNLYTDLSEKEANEMIAILKNRGIDASKAAGKENTWIVQVSSGDFSDAVDILSALGYPKDNFASLGTVFEKSGLVSSPTEERIRFMYALSQQLAETLTHIDGVLTARVNIVLQENNPLNEVISPSSAAVFIKYRRGSGVEDAAAMIKNMVTNSIEGLSYDKVTVAFFPSDLSDYDVEAYNASHAARSSNATFWVVVGSILFLLVVAILATGYWYWENQKKPVSIPPKTEEE